MNYKDIKILVVEDDESIRDAIIDTLEMTGYQVEAVVCAEDAIVSLNSNSYQLILSDMNMPGLSGIELLKKVKQDSDVPFILITAYGTVNTAIEAMRFGAADYLMKPFDPKVLLNAVSQFAEAPSTNSGNMVSVSDKSQRMVEMAKKVAATNATVLLQGESGTGKEVLARMIHQHSDRANGPFVGINCAAIPENMLESTLFGYEKGAYTGAIKSSPGKFELANGGTLLLDEISEMDLNLQAKLLRVLQESEVERLGSNKAVSLDVRVIATTNRQLSDEVRQNKFREDLFYRLNVFPILLPSLRERKADIEALAGNFISKSGLSQSSQVVIDASAIRKLESYTWPGNIRELENVIQRALILSGGQDIHASHIELFEEMNHSHDSNMPASDDFKLNQDMKAHENEIILSALKKNKGSRKDTAEQLGISPRTLRYKLAKLRDGGVEIPGESLASTI